MNPQYFSQLIETVKVVVNMSRLGHLEMSLEDQGSGMRNIIAFTNKQGETKGLIEPKLEDIDECGNHITLIDAFLTEFKVSQEDREELEKGWSITLEMTGMQYVHWLMMQYGCIQYQQEQLTGEYIDWCHANGHAD